MSSTEQSRIPARAEGLISRELDGGFVVLEAASDAAHHITGVAADVWRHAGTEAPQLQGDEVDQAVAMLLEHGLLTAPADHPSRRMLLRVGGVAALVAGIESIALPAAAQAGSNPLPINSTGDYSIPFYIKTVTFSLKGGGGGGGSNGNSGAGGEGGAGATVSGTIALPNIASGFNTLTVKLGAGGAGGATAIAGAGGGGGGLVAPTQTPSPGNSIVSSSPFSAGGNGGGFVASSQAGTAGGGGGASAILVNNTPIVIAGGGGGGGRGHGATGGAGGDGGLVASNGSSPAQVTTYGAATAIGVGNGFNLGTISVSGNNVTFPNASTTILVAGDWVTFSPGRNGLASGTFYRVLAKSSGTTGTLDNGSGGVLPLAGTPNTATTATRQAVIVFTSGSTSIRFPLNQNPGVSVGDKITFSGVNGPTNITAGTEYFVLTTNTTGGGVTTITISATSGGSAISLNANGYATGANRLAATASSTYAAGETATSGTNIATGGGAGTTTTGGAAGGGTGGSGANGGTAGSSGSIVSGVRTAGNGGWNGGTTSNRTGGGGGGGWGPGGGGQSGTSGQNSAPGAGGGGGSSYWVTSTNGTNGAYVVSAVSSSTGVAGGAGGAASGTNAGQKGSDGTISLG